GVLACALGMDKLRTKRMWKAEGLPTPDYLLLHDEDDLARAEQRFGYPLIIKPSEEGSSVGVSKVKKAEQLQPAFALARGETHRVVMAEQFISGQEFTCAIFDGEALPVIRIVPDGEFYDYNAKYISNETKYHCPAGLDPAHEKRLKQVCEHAFELLGASGWGRVDFMLDAQGEPWLIEVNLVPGMTAHSLVPMAAKAAGMSYADLCWALLETTLGDGDVR
ncbi:MAG: D-alanine--D-alanine ligase, partial [Stenotrophobium sp.]